MAKYSEKLVMQIVELIEQDMFTVSEICNIMQISRRAFYDWTDNKPEFKEAIEKAREHCEEKLLMNARLAMQKKIEGYTLTETITTYMPDDDDPTQLRIKKKVVKTKEYPPNSVNVNRVIERADKQAEEKRYQAKLYKPMKPDIKSIAKFSWESSFPDEDENYTKPDIEDIPGLQTENEEENVTA